MTFLQKMARATDQNPQTFARDAFWFFVLSLSTVLLILSPILLLSLAPRLLWPSYFQPTAAQIAPWIVPGVLLYAAYLFGSIWFGAAKVSGWELLATRFPAPTQFQGGRAFSLQNLSVGGAGYNNIARLRVAPEGLFVAMPRLFSLFHPPLLIPWSAIIRASLLKIWKRNTLILVVGTPKMASLCFNSGAFIEAVQEFVTVEDLR